MKLIKALSVIILATGGLTVFTSWYSGEAPAPLSFPYKQAGLTERQAAAHLLSRFSYGAKPGDIDAVVKAGPENWFLQQLASKQPDDRLNNLLKGYDAINLSNAEVAANYPKGAQVLRMAVKDGVIDKNALTTSDKAAYKASLTAYMKQKGLKPQQELYRQFINQKILRAAYTNNQLQELLTDFWFNHFNVSLTKNASAEFIPAYERDVIRPRVFGKFEDLLIATAKSPAMLTYLDNFSSSGVPEASAQRRPAAGRLMQGADSTRPALQKLQQAKQNQGLNENYAREVMELHTLGVDGGYTQNDVTQAARVLTGWTLYPLGDNAAGNGVRQVVERLGENNLAARGYVHDGDFLFTPNRHDSGEKTVLGRRFPAGGGYNEGAELLKMLAHHSSTSKFISRKLAQRFVNDNPPQALVDEMAKTFSKSGGDISAVLTTMVSSPAFWSKEALREKTKSPFELAISTVRALNASVKQPYQLFSWMEKMGQKIYYYQAPTGFPDRGQYWINTGALLNRMNFGLAFAANRIPGISFDLAALNNNHEPESAEAALNTYSRLMMPERELDETIKRLSPMLNEKDLAEKIEKKANGTAPAAQKDMMQNEDAVVETEQKNQNENRGTKKAANDTEIADLPRIVGIIIGSPEFQRK